MTKTNFLFFGLILVFLTLLNIIFPAQSDDISHYLNTTTQQGFLHSYYHWNGRFGEILYSGFFAKYNNTIALNLLNACIGTLFFITFFLLIFAKIPKDKFDYLSLSLVCIILLNVNFAAIFLWLSGSFNYLLGNTLIIIALIPYRFFWAGSFHLSSYQSYIFGIFFGIFCIFAGWSSEHIGASVSFLFFLSLFYAFYKKIKLPFWYYLGIIGFLCGWMILLLSPGSAKRVMLFIQTGEFITLKQFISMGLIDQFLRINQTLNQQYQPVFAIFLFCFSYFYLFIQNIKVHLLHLLCTIPLMIIFACVFFKHVSGIIICIAVLLMIYNLTKTNKKYYLFAFLFCFWMLNAFAAIPVGSLPLRAKFAPILVLITLILLMFKDFYKNNAYKKLIQSTIQTLLAFSILASLLNWTYVRFQWEKMLEDVRRQKAQGLREIIVSKKYFHSFYKTDWGVPNIGGKNTWPNTSYAEFFDVESFDLKE